MSSTLSRVLYALRAAKNIERKMLCEAFTLLARLDSLEGYSYVGFGALGFHDHALVHRRLGITDLRSIEKNEMWKRRVDLNKPYRVKMMWGTASERLKDLDWDRRTILWLDYDDPLDDEMLDDIHYATSQARSGSVLVVTVSAHPEVVHPLAEAPAKRLATLRAKVGEARVPHGTTGKDLSGWGLARVSRLVICDEIREVLRRRNAALPEGARVSFTQLFNFHYADGAKMLTFGGLLATEEETTAFLEPGMEGLTFIRRGEEPYEIEVPRLTIRETQFLDQKLPEKRASDLARLKLLPATQVERYRKLYRYFPAFTEIDTSV